MYNHDEQLYKCNEKKDAKCDSLEYAISPLVKILMT